MIKKVLLTLIMGMNGIFLLAQEINDGPYIFIENGQLIQKQIRDGKVIAEYLESDDYDTAYQIQPDIFKGVERIAALSDIHGQYDLAIEILQNNQIIDENLNWKYGEGHLVIVGDIFDRGPKVTETLWFIYKLEKQAATAGGAVHYLLGNHEYMVLHNDLRYLHEKYPLVSELLEMGYDDLYSKNTILGRWLRSKHTILKINEHLFVHGGISNDFIADAGVDIVSINETMRQSIDRSKEEMKETDFYSTYYGSSGPIWYRGYFYDPIPELAIDSILNQIESEHIVVGHCSNDEVVSRYNRKVFGVDSSIKKGEYGEILLLLDGVYFRGMMNGERIELK